MFWVGMALVGFVGTGQAGEMAPPRPNIVLILCDDLGYADVGFNGAQDIQTPTLDRLAQSGTIFTSAYVCHPFCGPSRMGLMTGRYPHCFGAPYNLPPSKLGMEEYANEGIPTSETLISTVLKRAGYYTGAIGKWHMGFAPPFHPNVRGFDDFYGFLGGGHMYFPERYQPIYERQIRNGVKHLDEYVTPLEHNGRQVSETEYLTDAFSREAVRFVRGAAAKDQPFFLYLAYNAPHTPLEAKEQDLARFENITDEKRRTYAAMVYAVDRGVRQIVDALRETGEYDDTWMIFLSDNGGKIGAGANNRPLKGGKGSVAEGGIRVPMFWHWPKTVPSGQRFDDPITALDFYPTFARLAGAEIPQGKKIDGIDVWDAVIGNRNPRAGQPIFALRHLKGFHTVGVRRDDWKITKLGPSSRWELFNLAEDISESHDVSRDHPDLVRDLVAAARRWSHSHTEPRWFDSPQVAKNWRDLKLPHYETTFLVRTEGQTSSTSNPGTETNTASVRPFGAVGDQNPGEWILIPELSDEFDGATIDSQKWNVDPKDFGVWSWEPENVQQKDGALHLTMVQQSHRRGDQELYYKSGMARNEKTITYGYFEARIKGCQRFPGVCPAFWLYSTGRDNRFRAKDGETVAYSEIDVVELQQGEFDKKTKIHWPVTRIDCNLHAVLMRDGHREWIRPNTHPDLCRNAVDIPWDPRDDYHVYAVENSPEWIVWYIDGKQVAKKPNLYWHLPMHLTLSLGLRQPFVRYVNGERYPVPEATTREGFPTTMSVDYVRVWRKSTAVAKRSPTDRTLEEFIAQEKQKWEKNGWRWNQAKVEANFREMDTNHDGLVSGKERQTWFANKKKQQEAGKQ